METASAPIYDLRDFNVETLPHYLIQPETKPRLCKRLSFKSVFNGIVYILLVCALTFIIYDNHKIIGIYFNKLRKTKV